MASKSLVSFVVLYYLCIFSWWVTDRGYKTAVGLKFYDIGQGDAILIKTPHGKLVLVDGGPAYTVDKYLFEETKFLTCTLDLVLLSHPHADHLEGINRVLTHCKVKTTAYFPSDYESRSYRDFKELAQNPIMVATTDSFIVDGVYFYVVWPPKNSKSAVNLNNDSLVVLVKYKACEALLTGDVEADVAGTLAKTFPYTLIDGQLEILKVAHHGAANGLYAPFYDKISIKTAIISVGTGNTYGHPSPKVLDYFAGRGITVLRTDQAGTITLDLCSSSLL